MTKSISKQLLPIYDKPMIYHPISTLMLANIREILIITTPGDQEDFKELLGDGSQFGLSIQYEIQIEPRGLAESFIIAEKFLSGESAMMVLGDNLFYGVGLGTNLATISLDTGCRIFATKVSNPQDYGVLEFNSQNQAVGIIEKPPIPPSNWAVTGLYMFDNDVVEIAKSVKPSVRGEIEITSIIDHYLVSKKLEITKMGRGDAWFDTGTPSSLIEASNFVRTIEERTGLKIACLEEIAWSSGWIQTEQLKILASQVGPAYRDYLLKLIES